MPVPKFFKNTFQILKDTFTSFVDHKVPKLSGSLAYYTVFSMAPLLVVIIMLCGIFLQKEAVEGEIYEVMRGFIGQDSAAQLQDIIKNASLGDKSNIAAVISIITLLIGATTVFAEIQDSINTIWGLKAKPKRGWLKFLKNRFLSFSMIISLAFILLVSLGVTGFIESAGRQLRARFPDVAVIIFYILNLVLTLGVSMLIFAVIFKVLPDAKIKWRDVFAGAFITAVLFLLGKFGISFYISQANVGGTFGAAGSLAILLVWVYYSAIILYLGACFTKAYALKFGNDIFPDEYAVSTKEIEIESGSNKVN